ncbi:DNA primase [Candidatus Woesearchaeota archaeon]|nr:DNA primase [Candidatus Woesearchaeota archaeon]
MGKVSPVSAKYIVHSSINIEGVVDKPDVIGAVFGQTEGLLGSDLELRELQRSGRIGRIEVNVDTRNGKTSGVILIPSSLDKAETSIVAAALEVIERIGPCNARLKVEKIEDVRVSKRSYVVNRAKELLKNLIDTSMPDSQELADEVMFAVRVMEIQEYGKDRLPAGPGIEDGDEILVVEGRADVVNLLKHGFKNAVAINGSSIPETVVELCKRKIVTVFVDGDRGGDLILKSLLMVADIDYITKAPDGKEVEEITKKEIHQALRARVVPQQIRLDRAANGVSSKPAVTQQQQHWEKKPLPSAENEPAAAAPLPPRVERPVSAPVAPPLKRSGMSPQEKDVFRGMSEELIGSRAAYLLDGKLNILGKVPVSELQLTLKGLSNVNAIVFDGIIERDLLKAAESAGVKRLVGMDNRAKQSETPVLLATVSEL